MKPGKMDLEREVEYGGLGDDAYERQKDSRLENLAKGSQIDEDCGGGLRHPIVLRTQQTKPQEKSEGRKP